MKNKGRPTSGERPRMVLLFIHAYKEQHDFSPNIREIGNAVGITSTSVVNYYLNRLEEKGWIGFLYLPAPQRKKRQERERAARTVHLTEAGKKEIASWLKKRQPATTFPVHTGDVTVAMPAGIFERRAEPRASRELSRI
jgi:SOS-response transcriptional repressor LexA